MEDIDLKIMLEGLNMQLESLACASITHGAQLRHIANEAGIVIDDVPLTDQEKKHRDMMIQSVAERMVKMSMLAVGSDMPDDTQKKIGKNVFDMMEEAVKTKGESIADDGAISEKLFAGVFDEEPDAPTGTVTGRFTHTEPNVEETPRHDDMADALAYSLDAPVEDEVEEDPANHEDATDEDLLAVFRSTRKARVEDAYVEFEDGTIRANFYNPDTVPLDPEEFMDYDRKAITYFKSILEKAKRAGLIDVPVAAQVNVVLHGGVNFNQEEVMTKDGKITQIIVEQGHEQPYFEVNVSAPIEAAETIIAAYSVSVARLRGAYVQAKLQELEEYMEAPE